MAAVAISGSFQVEEGDIPWIRLCISRCGIVLFKEPNY